jgi:hypothetical protein
MVAPLLRCVVLRTATPGSVFNVLASCWQALSPYAMIDPRVKTLSLVWNQKHCGPDIIRYLFAHIVPGTAIELSALLPPVLVFTARSVVHRASCIVHDPWCGEVRSICWLTFTSHSNISRTFPKTAMVSAELRFSGPLVLASQLPMLSADG